jgi:hypothetical protein
MAQQNQIVPQENPRPSVAIDDNGMLRPRSIEEAFRVATAFHKSGLLPQRYNSPEMVLTAMQLALELRLQPLTAMRQIAVINGTPSLYGDLPLSLCYASGKLEWIKEVWLDKDGNVISLDAKNLNAPVAAAVCRLKRVGDPEVLETSFTMAEAAAAGLANKDIWKAYPKRMLRFRARQAGLKDKFPDVLNGIAVAEYDFHESPPMDHQAPIVTAQPLIGPAADLNAKFTAATKAS